LKYNGLLKEAFYTNILVFILMAMLAYIPFNMTIFNPIKEEIKDFKFTDLYYSKLRESSNLFEKDVVLVNIGEAKREEIAEMLQILNGAEPKIIALDILFSERKEPAGDSLLRSAFAQIGNKLILSNHLEDSQGEYTSYYTNPWFGEFESGHVNFVGSNPNSSTIRYFRPEVIDSQKSYSSFASVIVNRFAPEKIKILNERNNRTERIHYLGNYDKFIHFDRLDISEGNPDLEILKDKIVVVGYLGPEIGTNTLDDIYFTPLNQEIAGRTLPDTYGVVIHANIISMILRGDYINKMSTFISIIVAFVVCYLHLILFTYFFVKNHIWYHLAAKVAQLITSILLLYIVFVFFSNMNYEINSTIIIVSILLSVDVLYLYESVAAYLYTKKGFQSYFIQEH
jgi:CHASE2 domain-containing sensor protein